MVNHDTTNEPEGFPERPECDFNSPNRLDERYREAEGMQLEMFPEILDENEKKIVRRLKQIMELF